MDPLAGRSPGWIGEIERNCALLEFGNEHAPPLLLKGLA